MANITAREKLNALGITSIGLISGSDYTKDGFYKETVYENFAVPVTGVSSAFKVPLEADRIRTDAGLIDAFCEYADNYDPNAQLVGWMRFGIAVPAEIQRGYVKLKNRLTEAAQKLKEN